MSNQERFKSYVAVYLVLVKGGEVLLSRRYHTGYQDGNYSLVAGHLDGGETAKTGIIREVAEEAGITLNPANLKVVHVMHRLAPDREYFDIYLQAEKWAGEVTNCEPDKCSELKWFGLKSLPDNIVPEVKQALQNISQNLFYGEFGWADKKPENI